MQRYIGIAVLLIMNLYVHAHDALKEVITGLPAGYAAVLASTLGHEMGHATLMLGYGGKIQIGVQLNGAGFCNYALKRKFPAFLVPIRAALGPIAGIATNFGILTAANIFRQYQDAIDSYQAFVQGTQKPFINSDQNAVFQGIVILDCLRHAGQFMGNKTFIDPKTQTKYLKDGQVICEHFQLRGKRASFLRGSLGTMALGITGYMFIKDYIR